MKAVDAWPSMRHAGAQATPRVLPSVRVLAWIIACSARHPQRVKGWIMPWSPAPPSPLHTQNKVDHEPQGRPDAVSLQAA